MKQPNLVYVFPDEFSQRAMGFRREDPVITPNLDKFANEGFELTEMISNYPVCSPYRGMLFTGCYPHSTGIRTNCHSESVYLGNYLKEDEICISDVLAENGYETGYIGKWHLDPSSKDQNPYTEGVRDDGKIWDSFTTKNRRHQFKFWHSYGCCDNHNDPHYWATDSDISERIEPKEWSATHDANIAIDYIKNANNTIRDENKPFCLFVAMNPPHMPFDQVPQKYKDMYKDIPLSKLLVNKNVVDIPLALNGVRDYYSSVTGVDDQFGRILASIKEKNIENDTIVVFTSDHGELMGSHGLMNKNSWYRESANVPFIIRYPAMNLRGKTDEVMNVPDIFPTLLELMGLKDKIPTAVEGLSCAQIFAGGTSCPYAYFGSEANHTRGVISKKYTYAIQKNQSGNEIEYLFDNVNDYAQLYNIADSKTDVIAEYRKVLAKMCMDKNDPWLSDYSDFINISL